MRGVLVFIFCLFFSLPLYAPLYAEELSCNKLQEQEKSIKVRSNILIEKYREEVSIFGFSVFMIKEKDHEDAGKNIIRMADIVNGCRSLISDKTCRYVSKEIISLISKGVELCSRNAKLNCGVC